ncbi:hypothetical protein K8R61_02840 [bacterium]|nr:hypothetical protein [bacterium]
MATLKVPYSLAFSFNKAKTLKKLGNALKSDSSFITFFIELNEFDKKELASELIQRFEELSSEGLIAYYREYKDLYIRNLIRIILLTREDFVSKMHKGDFICTI